jgi:hypothetical protein
MLQIVPPVFNPPSINLTSAPTDPRPLASQYRTDGEELVDRALCQLYPITCDGTEAPLSAEEPAVESVSEPVERVVSYDNPSDDLRKEIEVGILNSEDQDVENTGTNLKKRKGRLEKTTAKPAQKLKSSHTVN